MERPSAPQVPVHLLGQQVGSEGKHESQKEKLEYLGKASGKSRFPTHRLWEKGIPLRLPSEVQASEPEEVWEEKGFHTGDLTSSKILGISWGGRLGQEDLALQETGQIPEVPFRVLLGAAGGPAHQPAPVALPAGSVARKFHSALL